LYQEFVGNSESALENVKLSTDPAALEAAAANEVTKIRAANRQESLPTA